MINLHGHTGGCFHTLTFEQQHAALHQALLGNDREMATALGMMDTTDLNELFIAVDLLRREVINALYERQPDYAQ